MESKHVRYALAGAVLASSFFVLRQIKKKSSEICTLYYIPVRARAENIRMMFYYSGIPFNDIVFPWNQWPQEKMSDKIPFGQVPVLKTQNGTYIAQSGSISRYVAKLTGLYPSDPIVAAFSDSVFEMAQDLTTQINRIANLYSGEKFINEKTKYFTPILTDRLKNITHALGHKLFFGGDSPLYGDFMMWHSLDMIIFVKRFEEDDFVLQPSLMQWMKRMKELPGNCDYLRTRPESGFGKIGKVGSLTYGPVS